MLMVAVEKLSTPMKHKFNINILTKEEIIRVNNGPAQVLWNIYILEVQGYKASDNTEFQ